MPKVRIDHPPDGKQIDGIEQLDKQWAFVASGRALDPNLRIKATLIHDKSGKEAGRKILVCQAPTWVVVFEDLKLDDDPTDYTLKIYDGKNAKAGSELRTCKFKLKGAKARLLQITFPPTGTVLCTNPVCYGRTDEDSPVTGSMNDGTQVFAGNTPYQSSTSGVYAIQFNNLPVAGGYELDVTNAAGTLATPSTGLTVQN
jgi:hypothetical protein